MADSLSVAGKDAYITPSKLSTSTAIVGRTAEELGMDDFFNLLVAQMTNQDMMDPASDTEFISQMAQFTTLRGMQIIQEYQLSSYATSYVGKTVAIAHTSESTGTITRTEGVVDTVTFYDGEPKVVVKGISYPLYSVMEVKTEGSSSYVSMEQASTYIGKTVTIEYVDDEDNDVEKSGVVTGVISKEGNTYVVLDDDEEYLAAHITSVK